MLKQRKWWRASTKVVKPPPLDVVRHLPFPLWQIAPRESKRQREKLKTLTTLASLCTDHHRESPVSSERVSSLWLLLIGALTWSPRQSILQSRGKKRHSTWTSRLIWHQRKKTQPWPTIFLLSQRTTSTTPRRQASLVQRRLTKRTWALSTLSGRKWIVRWVNQPTRCVERILIAQMALLTAVVPHVPNLADSTVTMTSHPWTMPVHLKVTFTSPRSCRSTSIELQWPVSDNPMHTSMSVSGIGGTRAMLVTRTRRTLTCLPRRNCSAKLASRPLYRSSGIRTKRLLSKMKETIKVGIKPELRWKFVDWKWKQ